MPMKLALELYSVRDLYREDFDACLQKVAKIGYVGVECFGEPFLPADDVKRMLDKHGLALAGWHTPIDLLEGDAFIKTVAYFHRVGCTRAIVPFMPPEVFESRASVLAFAERMNAISQRLAQHKIALGYHNHGAEFVPLEDGTLPWALLMDNTNILAQLDNGNALTSCTPGLNVTKLVGQWPGRAITIHAKPYSHKDGLETMIGEDDIDWDAFLYAAEHTGGTEWVIVEYEEEKCYGQFEGAELCFRALQDYM